MPLGTCATNIAAIDLVTPVLHGGIQKLNNIMRMTTTSHIVTVVVVVVEECC